MNGRSKFALPSMDRGRPRPLGSRRLRRHRSACAKPRLRFGRCGRGRPRSMNVGVRLHDCLSKFPVIPRCEGISSNADRTNCGGRAVPFFHAKNRRITGEITGGITGKRTGEKALFRNVKRLNQMEIFLPEKLREKIAKKTIRLPRRKGLHACRSNAGNSAGRKSPAPKDQAIESAADFGVKKFSHMNPPSGRESSGRREDERWNWEARARATR